MLRERSWPTIFILAAISLIQPLLNIVGLFDAIGPASSVIVSVIIAVIWIAFAVSMRVINPVLVLAAAGAVYAILSILLAALLQTLLPGTLGDAPVSLTLLLTAGLAGALFTNIIWGAFLGLTSKVIMNVNSR